MMKKNSPPKPSEKNPLPEPTAEERSRAASILGRAGGKKGGPARAKSLSPEKRKAISEKAIKTRWDKPESDMNSLARTMLDRVINPKGRA